MHLSTGTPRHVKFRERKGPSQGVLQQSELHKCSPHAPKFEDRTQEETLQQERCTGKDAWEMTKHVHKLEEKDKATLYSLSDVWCHPAPSSSKPEERQFGVDFGASMHMLSRKDLNLAVLETVWVSRNPTTAITANGEVQTHVEASVYVRTWSYSSRYKSSRTRLRSFRWENTAKITDIHMSGPVAKNRISLKTAGKIQCNTENYEPIVVPGWSTGPSSSSASASPTSFPQDKFDDSSSSPRRRSTSIPVFGNQLRDPTETPKCN